ncbi:beta-lactamase family protein [Mucilaginibacter sp. RS28]|uniref:Beta-lactamase family protein n=1 Tax=Mucilaginibacter straminoryzae TaxID=2932774 RepID=A0A9X2BC90_9SPHI|nr:serine hydrolase domain-containing protein [Mucilaginibacter straminoryzae]MCJ8210647.1 beta-lactamase family protein [Mucilaginibacter straminoryzae]
MKRFIHLITFIITSYTASAQSPAERVDEIIRREMQERKVPGLQIAIVKNGEIELSRSYGLANLQDSVPVDNRTIFPINSCTKVFTSVAVMRLVEAGKVNLSAPVAAYLDSLPPSWQKVTVRQLLTHTSGLPDLLKLLDPNTGGLAALKTEKGAWEKLKAQALDFQPGERFSYNQTNGYLLGKIIEKFSVQPFAEVYAETQFGPLNMSHTLFGDSRDVIPHYAPTYFFRGALDGRRLTQPILVNNYYEFPYFRRTGSGLNSTAEDVAHWLIALQSGKLIASKALRDTMWSQAKFNNGQPTPWALGWGIAKVRPKHRAMGMSGGGRAAFLLYPDDDLAVIVFDNLGNSNPEDYLEEIAACYLPDIAEADPLTFLRTNLRKVGFDKAIAITEAQMKKDPGFRPNEFELNEWAYRMLDKNQLPEATAILQLNVHLFPNSSNAYDSYGEALLKSGRKSEAMKMYKRSLALDSHNDHAKRVLRENGQ